MKPGNLVKIKRAGIGVPTDTIGLILKTVEPRPNEYDILYHEIQLCGLRGYAKNRVVRRLERDLEVVNASR
jgi:hypothetical protein